MEKFELTPKEEGQPTLYNENINPGITNVFATAAFRFGHSLIDGIQRYSFKYFLFPYPV